MDGWAWSGIGGGYQYPLYVSRQEKAVWELFPEHAEDYALEDIVKPVPFLNRKMVLYHVAMSNRTYNYILKTTMINCGNH